ncbi:hypothetical protein BSKO_11197 [Bryopsis sp. KO-2023]|nr:hypothetical protein BSKO_11197 [Bryopsis sp. KO-2023]
MPVSQLQTMEELINRKTLYVSNIDRKATKYEIKSDLQVVCQRELGSIGVPVDDINSSTLGYAYCNFNSTADAKEALQRFRFNVRVAGKPVTLTFSVGKDHKKVIGAWGNRLTAFIKNLSPEVDEKMLCEKFEKFGEVFRCKVDADSYGSKYGMVQYTKEKATIKAIETGNNTTWFSTVIKVERHAKTLPGNGEVMTAIQQAGLIEHMTPPISSNGSITPPPHGRSAVDIRPEEWPESSPPLAHPCPSFRPAPFAPRQPDTANRYKAPSFGGTQQPYSFTRPLQDTISTISSCSQPSEEHVVTINGRDLQSFDTQPNAGMAAFPGNNIEIPGGSPSSSFGSVEKVAMKFSDVGGPSPAPYGILGLMAEQSKLFSADPSEEHPAGRFKGEGQLVEGGAPPGWAMERGQQYYVKEGGVSHGGRMPMSIRNAVCHLSNTAGAISALLGPLERITDLLLCCPITQEVFKDPVVAADGHTYERSALEKWLQKSKTSPFTNLELPNNTLTPNVLIKKIIEELNIR